MTDVEQPNPNVASPSFASNTAYYLRENIEITNANDDLNISVSSGDKINDTNDDLNTGFNSEAEITDNNDQMGVNKEIDREYSSECKLNFGNSGGILKQINEDLLILYLFLPPQKPVTDINLNWVQRH